jgi:hypothetical protein
MADRHQYRKYRKSINNEISAGDEKSISRQQYQLSAASASSGMAGVAGVRLKCIRA